MPPLMQLTLSPPPPPPARGRIIILAFLIPKDDAAWLNRLVAKASKHRTCHVEIVFEDDMAFSIYAGAPVYFRHRSFSNPDYTLLSVSVTNAEYVSLYSFCQSAATHNIGFTDVGMVLSYIQPARCPVFNTAPSSEVGFTFCSKIVTEALQFADLPEVEHLIPCTATPSCLYDAFESSPRRVLSSVGYRREQLRQVGVVRV
jgi:hypothetical protein